MDQANDEILKDFPHKGTIVNQLTDCRDILQEMVCVPVVMLTLTIAEEMGGFQKCLQSFPDIKTATQPHPIPFFPF